MSHHGPAIIAALQEIAVAIKAGSKLTAQHTTSIQHLVQTVSQLQKKVDAMSAESDALTAQVTALVAEVQAAVAKVADSTGDKAAMVAATTQLKTVADQLHAATNPA
jgi:septal ring factor EnvC (AmiA/AmiB activator)